MARGRESRHLFPEPRKKTCGEVLTMTTETKQKRIAGSMNNLNCKRMYSIPYIFVSTAKLAKLCFPLLFCLTFFSLSTLSLPTLLTALICENNHPFSVSLLSSPFSKHRYAAARPPPLSMGKRNTVRCRPPPTTQNPSPPFCYYPPACSLQ